MAFDVHRGEFVQILHVHNSHWCVVSNIGCDDGVVHSLYPSVSSATMCTIASLLFSPASELVVKVMGVQRQSNSSDCGVFAIAFALDICSGHDPCTTRYDQKSLRKHLAKCLEDCKFTRFPTLGERKSSQIKCIQKELLHCSCRLPDHRGVDVMAECDSYGIDTAWTFQVRCLVTRMFPGSARNVNVSEDPLHHPHTLCRQMRGRLVLIFLLCCVTRLCF